MDLYSIPASATTVLMFLAFLGICRVGLQQPPHAPPSRRRRTPPFALPDEAGAANGNESERAVMSDFTSDFWSWYVIVLTLGSHRVLRRGCCGR